MGIRLAPSILSADFARLAEEIKAMERGGADLLHCDVMDGRFVPNITFGPLIVEAVNRLTDLPLDVHLMILEPEKYVSAFRNAGADFITVHIEASADLPRTLELIKEIGAKAGVSLNPDTPIESIEPYIKQIDLILIMSVFPGFGGQDFIPFAYERLRAVSEIRKKNKSDFLISVDGGVEESNARRLVASGADILVAGSSIFHTADPEQALRNLRRYAEKV